MTIDTRPARPVPLNRSERFFSLPTLYGSQARVESDGTIYLPRWREKNGTPTQEVVRIQKDGGSVEAGIRYTDHVLENVLGKEKEQMALVLNKTDQLLVQLESGRLLTLSGTEREAFQNETAAELGKVGLDPELVRLQVKKLIHFWTVKASRGEDSLQRRNKLISAQSAEAAARRAEKRLQLMDETTAAKYLKIRAALMLERAVSRSTAQAVIGEINMKFLPNKFMINAEAKLDKSLGYTKAVAGHLAWLLKLSRVNPYRQAGRDLSLMLEMAETCLEPQLKHNIFSLQLPQKISAAGKELQIILFDHKKIYND